MQAKYFPFQPTSYVNKYILLVFQDGQKKEESLQWLKNAAKQGSCHAAYDLWKLRFCEGPMEPYSKLERLRELRDCAKTNHPDAQLTLALEYAKGNLGGVTKTQVAEFTLQVNPFTNLSIFQALVKNDQKWSHLHTTVWNGLYVPFFKFMPWSCEIPTSLVSRNVCSDENCRFNKIPWNQVNVNGFDNFDNFFNQILQSKINLADLTIFSPYSLLHVFPDIWNKLPCIGLIFFSFYFFIFFLLPCSLSQDPGHLIATSFLSFKLNSTAQWGKDLLPYIN